MLKVHIIHEGKDGFKLSQPNDLPSMGEKYLYSLFILVKINKSEVGGFLK